jgi:hypothetical protein
MRLHWFFVVQLQHELLYRRIGAGCHSIVSLNSLCRGHDEEPACLTQTTTVVPALCTARPRSPSHPARAESLGERISRRSSRAHGGRRSWRAPSTGALRLCGLQLSAVVVQVLVVALVLVVVQVRAADMTRPQAESRGRRRSLRCYWMRRARLRPVDISTEISSPLGTTTPSGTSCQSKSPSGSSRTLCGRSFSFRRPHMLPRQSLTT